MSSTPMHWSISEPTTLPLDDARIDELFVSLVAGRIDVVAHDLESGATIEITEVTGPPLEIDLSGGTLRIRHRDDSDDGFFGKLFGAGSGHRTARVSVTVPTRAAAELKSVSADLLLSGTEADVTLKTVSGDITVDSVTGAVRVSSTSGNVDAHRLDGTLTVNQVSGQVTALQSKLQEVHINNVSGNLTLDLTSSESRISSKSVSGDVTVRVPGGRGWDMSIKSVSGDAVVDGRSIVSRGPGKSVGHATDGDCATVLETKSVSGNVVLLRQDQVS